MVNGFETYTAARKYLYNMPRNTGGSRGGAGDGQIHGHLDSVMRGGHRGDVSKNSRSSKFTRSELHRNMKEDILCERKTPKTASPSDLASTSGPTKLRISNLDYEVSSLDIQELFEDYGVLQRAAVNSNRAGRSNVTADVVFEKRDDALKAFKELNGRNFDGKPLKIEISTSELYTHEESSGSGGSDGRNARRSDAKRKKGRRESPNERAGAEDGKRSAFTAEQLDEELDAYMASVKEAKRRK